MKLGKHITIGTVVNHKGCIFNGEVQNTYNVVLTGYLGRDENGDIFLYNRKPEKRESLYQVPDDIPLDNFYCMKLDPALFPNVKWEDDQATEVTIIIK